MRMYPILLTGYGSYSYFYAFIYGNSHYLTSSFGNNIQISDLRSDNTVLMVLSDSRGDGLSLRCLASLAPLMLK